MNDVELQKTVQILRNNGQESLAKSLTIQHYIQEDLKQYSLDDYKDDLNPQLGVKDAVNRILINVKDFGFECGKEEIYNIWLTMMIFCGKFGLSK